MTNPKRTPRFSSLKQLEKLFDSLHEIVCAFDREGRFVYVNRACYRLWGYKPEELLGVCCLDLMVEEDVGEAISTTQAILTGANVPAFENRYYRKDGTVLIMSWEGGWDFGDELIYATGRDVTEKRRLEEQLRQEREQQQKQLTHTVIKATEEERAFVGRELHDSVNQVLTTVKLYTEVCLSQPDQQETLLRRAAQLLQISIDEIRGLSKRLSAPALGGTLLKDSVKELVDAINVSSRLRIHYEHHIGELLVPQEVHIALYRILQEHFTNILKHAQASHVQVRLSHQENTLCLHVQDNGCGFDPLQYRKGIGMENMTSRAESVGGQLVLNSAPGQGCTLQATIPLPQ